MKITAECSIDIDAQRKIWVSADAEISPENDNPGEVMVKLAQAAASGANKAHDHAIARLHGQRAEDDPPRAAPMGTPGYKGD